MENVLTVFECGTRDLPKRNVGVLTVFECGK